MEIGITSLLHISLHLFESIRKARLKCIFILYKELDVSNKYFHKYFYFLSRVSFARVLGLNWSKIITPLHGETRNILPMILERKSIFLMIDF